MSSRHKEEFDEYFRDYVQSDQYPTKDVFIQYVQKSVDPAISRFVGDLVLNGYPTATSCAGGPGHITKSGGMGFVPFNLDEPFSAEEKTEIVWH